MEASNFQQGIPIEETDEDKNEKKDQAVPEMKFFDAEIVENKGQKVFDKCLQRDETSSIKASSPSTCVYLLDSTIIGDSAFADGQLLDMSAHQASGSEHVASHNGKQQKRGEPLEKVTDEDCADPVSGILENEQ
ncbi:hypothetical protein K7X08_010019 [Anisodus acutangulus]|uniref:Uncharacterized protein n=1 Tax=Anisodus acutangulus TaxID=402998 RepID=A0A9Q1N421_9SOLA|nr:hypothetical protein K7X08_010019 [Anisodus acutangulus]